MRLASCTLKLEFAKCRGGVFIPFYTNTLVKASAANKYLKESFDENLETRPPLTRGNWRDVYASLDPTASEMAVKFEEVNSEGLKAIGDVLVRCSRMRRVDIYLDLSINHTPSIPLLFERVGEIIETMKAWKEIVGIFF